VRNEQQLDYGRYYGRYYQRVVYQRVVPIGFGCQRRRHSVQRRFGDA
jgi:hypothetical protein